MKILKIFIAITLIIIVIYFLFVGNGVFGIENIYLKNSKEFNNFAEYFLSQDEIKNMVVKFKKDDLSCEIINQWGICPVIDDNKWSKETNKILQGIPQKIYLNTLEEVLNYEKINEVNYNYIVDFLKKYHLQAIGKNDEKNMLEISIGLDGLRYYTNSGNNFKADGEYIKVETINEHWYKYRSDWN